jgi:PEP-CTERM/exosortase A-associated glycosyltransferase
MFAVVNSRTMRILHVLDHSVPIHSGYSFRTLSILKEQRALGWDTIQVTGPKQGPGHVLEEQVADLQFYRTPAAGVRFDSVPGLREMLVMRAIGSRIEQLASRLRPNILHAHSPVLNALPTLRAGRRLRTPVVYEMRGPWEDAAVAHGTTREGSVRYRLSRSLETWALKRADAITTICDGLKDDIISRGIPAHRVTVIPNAVDPVEFPGAAAADIGLKRRYGLEGTFVLGYIGGLNAYEGLPVLLRALQQLLLNGESVRALLVGDGQQEAELKTLAATLGIEKHVVFVGPVPHNEVPRYYALIDILVYPRLSMRLTELVTPLKPLEGMAQRRLVAASNVGGHRELICDGTTGILFPPGDPVALATTVIDLARSPGRWEPIKDNARRYVEETRSWRKSVEGYRDVYTRLLEPR